MAEFRDVGCEIFLYLRSENPEAQATHFVVSFDDPSLILLRCVFSNPAINLSIGRAGGNELFEFHYVESGKFPKIGAESARIKVVFSVDAEQIGPSRSED